jgi:hypothetical protein
VPADVAAPDADPLRLPVHVEPTQRQQLTHSQAAHRSGEDQRAMHPAELIVAKRTEHGLHLVGLEVADVLAPLHARTVDVPAMVGASPAALDRELTDPVE